MPEISSTMYPIIIAGAAAIPVLLLLLVVARRRRSRRDQPAEEHDTGPAGAEDESPGVKLIEDDDATHGEDDETRNRAGGHGHVTDGAETPPGATAGSPGVVDTSGSSHAGTAGSPGAGAGSQGLVSWGPDETGPEKLRGVDEPHPETDMGTAREAGAGTPAGASHSTGDRPRPASQAGEEPEAESHSGPETPPAESDFPVGTGLPPAGGTGHPEEESAGPEGQPFERDGRWWFRRDGELLVYDDATSEWKAAPETGSPPPETGAPVTAANLGKAAHGETLEGAATVATIEWAAHDPHAGALRPPTEGATFWKCLTCGATNGSAASGCRMCFAPRPS